MHVPKLLLVACLTSSWLAASAGADPFAPVTVSLPPEGQGDIFSPGVRLVEDLDEDWVEEEYFISGSVDVFEYDDPPQLHQLLLRNDTATDYTTRIIIRRPAQKSDFDGNVVVEWWNSTAQFDTAPAWDPSAEFFAREGWIYVGVSNADEAINFLKAGCPIFGAPPSCGTRYAALSLAEDGIAYEMVSQIVNLLRGKSKENPLKSYKINRVFHVGQSQQAGSVNTYAREFHQDALSDGYFIQAGGGGGRVLSNGPAPSPPGPAPGTQSPNFGFGDPRGLPPTNLSVPVIRAQTETEVAEFGVIFNRQADTANFRYYEIAGAAHLTVHEDVEVIPAGVLFPGSPPITLENLCLNDMNTLVDGPVFGKYVYNAMWKNLERQVVDAIPMPAGDLISINFLTFQIVRDGDGNAVGGIRTPDMNVPIGSYFKPTNEAKPACSFPGGPFPPNCNPIGGLGDLACFLAGSTIAFDQPTLDGLYSSHADYVDQVETDADRLSDEGFLLNRDSNEIVDRAEDSDIP